MIVALGNGWMGLHGASLAGNQHLNNHLGTDLVFRQTSMPLDFGMIDHAIAADVVLNMSVKLLHQLQQPLAHFKYLFELLLLIILQLQFESSVHFSFI